ncbi:MAG: M20/M25/M40 family metallo-hydrolase [Balneolaceae bacterium]|nr:M20/M25/M40 family metallo-hydrolase [Balneolaceae bacterium]
MKKKLSYIFISVLVLTAVAQCTNQKEPRITEESTVRVLKTLSSDEMKGRYSLSPDIEKAADFISAEFNSIGLSPLPELGSFRQNFTLYSISVDSAFISINNREISSKKYFPLIDTDSIRWNDDVAVLKITSRDKFRDTFLKYRKDNRQSIVLIDPAHKKTFYRYRNYFSRPSRTFKVGNTPADVFILGDKPIHSFRVFVESNIKKHELNNVAGMIEGKRKDEIVIFSAHYDHIGTTQSVRRDSIANGANDNASGTTAVIELARYYNALPTPERTIYFIAFTAEELGEYGSQYFADQIDPERFVAMINIAMIGKSALDGSKSAWITGFEKSDLGQIMQDASPDSIYKFSPDPYNKHRLFYWSDNIPFARLGIPAHTISSTPIEVDNDYHTVKDEFSTINIAHVRRTIQAIAGASRGIISAEKTPSRIDTTKLR